MYRHNFAAWKALLGKRQLSEQLTILYRHNTLHEAGVKEFVLL